MGSGVGWGWGVLTVGLALSPEDMAESWWAPVHRGHWQKVAFTTKQPPPEAQSSASGLGEDEFPLFENKNPRYQSEIPDYVGRSQHDCNALTLSHLL